MVLDATLLNTQHYKVKIKGKEEHSREKSSTLLLHLGVVAIEKEAFGSISTMVTDLTYITLRICNSNRIAAPLWVKIKLYVYTVYHKSEYTPHISADI